MTLKIKLLILFFVFWSLSGSAQTIHTNPDSIPFAPPDTYTTGGTPAYVFSADLDGDTDLDLAVGNRADYVSIFKNNGDGTFQPRVDYEGGDGTAGVYCADLDGDTDLDLVLANWSSGDISTLFNNGDGTFQNKVDYPAGDDTWSVVCGDFDGDGDQDVAAYSWGNYTVSVFKNNGDGTLQTRVDYYVGFQGKGHIFCVDLDDDSDLDLSTTSASILLNNGDGTFQLGGTYGIEGAGIFCSDLDGDCDLDIASATYAFSEVAILMNNGDGTFQNPVFYYGGSYSFAVFCADLDGDSYPEVAVTHQHSDWVSIFKNNGDGTFQDAVNYGTGYYPKGVSCSDLDGDSDMDMVVSNQSGGNIFVYKNLTDFYPNYPPRAFPLLSPADEDSVPINLTLDWRNSCDPNLGDSVLYDLYLSTVPDFNPDSTLVYDSLTKSELTDTLEIDTYYWKVRAYDNSGGERWSDQIWSFSAAFLGGDVNNDSEATIADVVYLVNYHFKSGPAPVPLASADVNCDNELDITDAVYLVNYFFKSGPPPC